VLPVSFFVHVGLFEQAASSRLSVSRPRRNLARAPFPAHLAMGSCVSMPFRLPPYTSVAK
jgi:hypothetical protein